MTESRVVTLRRMAVVALCLVASPAGAATTPLPPKPTRYVTDNAGVLPLARRDALNEKLAAFERATSNQLIIYVDRALPPGTTLEELGAAAIHEWGVGQKGRSNGVIFFVFVDERRMRLEVGYGLEGALPDARAREITSDVVKPLFLKGDYAAGIEAGAEAVLAAVRGEPFRGTGTTRAQTQTSWFRVGGVNSLGLLILLASLTVLLVAALLSWAYHKITGRPYGKPQGAWQSSSASAGFSSGESSSGSSDSGSSSDFSGGGGDGGGGGSSDSW
jgi:uncharacterized protein